MNRTTIEEMFRDKTDSDFTSMRITAEWGSGEDSHAAYLVNATAWRTYVLYKHGAKTFLYYGTQGFANFKKLFEDWLMHNQRNINVLAQAFYTEYNPLDNYDKNSEIRLNIEGTETNTRTLDTENSTTSEESSSNTRTGSVTTENSKVPYNENTFSETEKSVDTYNSLLDSGSSGGTATTTNTGTDTNSLAYENRYNLTTEHTRGNIGVTTSAQMIQGEMSIRFQSLGYTLLDNFINEFCYNMYIE